MRTYRFNAVALYNDERTGVRVRRVVDTVTVKARNKAEAEETAMALVDPAWRTVDLEPVR